MPDQLRRRALCAAIGTLHIAAGLGSTTLPICDLAYAGWLDAVLLAISYLNPVQKLTFVCRFVVGAIVHWAPVLDVFYLQHLKIHFPTLSKIFSFFSFLDSKNILRVFQLRSEMLQKLQNTLFAQPLKFLISFQKTLINHEFHLKFSVSGRDCNGMPEVLQYSSCHFPMCQLYVCPQY